MVWSTFRLHVINDDVNKCGKCEFQLISNLFDVICIQVIQIKLLAHCGWAA